MKEGPKLVGVKEIARRANVSIATVDRVLNNRTGVSRTCPNWFIDGKKDIPYLSEN